MSAGREHTGMGSRLRCLPAGRECRPCNLSRAVKRILVVGTVVLVATVIMTQQLVYNANNDNGGDAGPDITSGLVALPESDWLELIDVRHRINQPGCEKMKRRYTYIDDQDLMKMNKLHFIKAFKNPCWKDTEQRLHCLPYMYLAGVAKCGTSDLFKRISLHPDFIPPTDKEPSWLSSRRFYDGLSIENYTDQFFKPLADILQNADRDEKANLITGDASVNTLDGSHFWEFYPPNVNKSEPVENNAEYIYRLNPDTRILINVRNPVERLWSEYLAFSKDDNKTAEKFHTIAKEEIIIYNHCTAKRTLRSCLYDNNLAKFASMHSEERAPFITCQKRIQNKNHKTGDKPHHNNAINANNNANNRQSRSQQDIVMLRRGVYHVYIRDFLRVFPSEQILVQRLEDLAENLETSLLNTYKFLGLRDIDSKRMDSIMELGVRNSRVLHKDDSAGTMLPETREMLWQFYRPHNEELAKLLNNPVFNYGKE